MENFRGRLGRFCVTRKAEVRSEKMSGEIEESLPQEPQIECEATGSDAEHERGGKQAKFDDEDSDNDSTVSSSNSNSTQASIAGKRGFRGKGRKKRNLAFRCVNFLKVNELRLSRIFFQLFRGKCSSQVKKEFIFPRNVNYLLLTCLPRALNCALIEITTASSF